MTKLEEMKELSHTDLRALPGLPEGREYLVIVAHGWARHKNAATAFKDAKYNGAYFRRGTNWAVIYDVSPGTFVDDLGGICLVHRGDTITEVGKFAFQKP